jgi:hypothetical protein
MKSLGQIATALIARRHGLRGEPAYRARETAHERHEHEEIRKDPIADRKEAQKAFLDAMKNDPALVAERVRWLLSGTYGDGNLLLAEKILARPRTNRIAALVQMVGLIEWRCPEDMTRSAWKRLSASERAALDRQVEGEIRNEAENG